MKLQSVLSGLILAAGLSLAPAAAQAACTQTGFYVDGINMTAAEVNPVVDVTGPVDATGCNIGVFYDHTGTGHAVSSGANIHGANYFGVVVDGDAGDVAINVTDADIHDIGEVPHNGTQHGNAIFYINASGDMTGSVDDSRTCNATDHSVTGTVSGNTVTAYQKNGITAKCPGVSLTISDNTVTGAGEVDFIAQNGIELGQGAAGTISGNAVSDNQYTGTNNADSSGILVFGGPTLLTTEASVTGNTLTDNDVGIFSVNCGNDSCTIAPTTDTNNLIQGNTLSNADVSNVSGCGSPQGYQAAISELGRNDKINQNKFSGAGYTPNGVPCTGSGTTPAIFTVDRSARQGPRPSR